MSEEEIERITANLMRIADTEVRAQRQTEVAAESGVDKSYAVHAYPQARSRLPFPGPSGG